ncbi:MAG: ATP synthase F1 subunit gamma [Phycisphaeraceae bacterium]|nr:ATP synthase F1 subunit gamma [Phycisphaeraceae bacterium]
MASLKEINVKIASLKNTQKMTKTMKLVAASKMRRAQQAQEQARVYAAGLDRLLAGLAASPGDSPHPLMQARTPAQKALVLFVTSDRGLCAGFNNILCRHTAQWLEEQGKVYSQIAMSFCGRRGFTAFRNRVTVHKHYEGVTDQPRFANAIRIADEIMAAFLAGEFDAVYVGYNRFRSALSQTPVLEQLLPIVRPPAENQGEQARTPFYLFEPEEPELLRRLLPNAVRFQVFHVLLENAAGEHAARMAAMDNATRNAGDMIKFYTLKRNRERQAAITKELIEIVTGAESL